MKHIKLFEDWSDITDNDTISTLKDICLELQDIGFEVSFEHRDITYLSGIRNTGIIRIAKSAKNTFDYNFNFMEISGVVQRVKRYLGNNFIKAKVVGEYDSTYEVLNDNLILDKEIYECIIQFWKGANSI